MNPPYSNLNKIINGRSLKITAFVEDRKSVTDHDVDVVPFSFCSPKCYRRTFNNDNNTYSSIRQTNMNTLVYFKYDFSLKSLQNTIIPRMNANRSETTQNFTLIVVEK